MKRKRNKKSEATLTTEMAGVTTSQSADDLALEAMLAEIEGAGEPSADEIVEPTVDVEAAVEAATEAVVNEEAAPATTEVVPAAPEASKPEATEKKGKGRKKKEASPKEDKPKVERIFFGKNKVARLKHKLGDGMGDFMVLTMTDAELTGDELKAKQDETVAAIDKMGIKVKNRATNLIEYIAGKNPKINNVIHIALQTLATYGHIRTGDKGNLHAALLARPYSPAAARAMGNNTVAMLRILKVINGSSAKGEYTANPDSLFLAVLSDKLGLSFDVEQPADADKPTVEAVGTVETVAAPEATEALAA